MVIQAAAVRDLPEIPAVLEGQHLPVDGVDERVETTLVVREKAEARVVGTAALELYGDDALLRSVAIDTGFQGQRLGHALIAAALEVAHARGAETVFLLTNTAPDFFPRFGFERIARADAPASVQESAEFPSTCCASAVVMRKRLAATR
jgi:amino-acid N-acetyltransferase